MNKSVFIASVLAAVTLSLGGCKPRNTSALLETNGDGINIGEIVGQLAEVNGLLIKHSVMGEPLVQGDADTAAASDRLPPTPPRCDAEAWKSDPRWGASSITTLESYVRGAHDLRVKSAAIEALSVLSIRHGLMCAEDHGAELLSHLKDANGSYCDAFARCSIVLSLFESLAQLFPGLPELISALGVLEANIKSMKGGVNTRAILEFKLASLKTHMHFYRASGFGGFQREGTPVALEEKDRLQLKTDLADLYQLAYKRLFVVNQMRDNLNISPELVKRMILQDMLAGVDFKALEEDVQDLLLQEALGFYDSAWQMQVFNQSLQVYVDRLVSSDPRPWLEKVKLAARKWSGEHDSFDFESFSLTAEADLSESWEAGVNPRVAFYALTHFLDHEVKLPWRRAWTQATNVVFELIPPPARDLNIKSNYLKAMRAGAEHRSVLLRSLDQQGITQAAASVGEGMTAAQEQKIQNANESIRRVVASLLDREESLAAYFSHFTSVYDDFLELYDRMGDRMLLIQSIVTRMEDGSALASERKHLLERLDDATVRVLDQWLKIRCTDTLYTASRSSAAPTVIKEPFFLDSQIAIDFNCAPESSGEDAASMAQLRSRIGRYTGNITYSRSVDRGLAEVKEAAAIGMLLVIGLPSGIAGNAAAAGTRYLFAHAARVGLSYVLKKQLTRKLLAGAVNLYVNVSVFTALHKLSDEAWSGMLGIEHPPAPEETWGQYIFHTMQGMAVFASLHHVSRFSSGVAKRLFGVGGASGSKELASTLASKYRSSLKPTWTQHAAEFAIGASAETSMFFAMPYASEFLGTKVFGVYEELSAEEQAFQKLYSPHWSEVLKDSFATAVLFRTFGLLRGRGNMPESTEFIRFKESTRNSITGEMSKDQAFAILGVAPGSGADAVKAAHRKLSVKYHPDRVDGPASRTMTEALGGAEASKLVKQLVSEASRNTPFASAKTTLKLSEQQAAQIEPAYRQVQECSLMFKRVQKAFELASGV